MALSSKAIETLSVNAVRDSVITCDFLEPYIADNDKEPSWDGFVYVYSDMSKRKDKLKGRMPVQVKGKECNDHTKQTISYSMSTEDLNNYLKDAGCMLFVVCIGNSGLTKKIYYAELTPIKLRNILKRAKGQKSKTIKLKEFPTDNDQKATIFFNCLQNREKQASFKEGKLLSIEELIKSGALESFVIPVSSVGNTDPEKVLVQNEVYVYAKTKNCSIPQPIDVIPQDVCIKRKIDALITVDDKIFYAYYSIVKGAKSESIFIGDSVTIELDKDNQSWTIRYKESNKIRVLAKDLDFMLSWLEKGYFEVKGTKFPIDNDSINFKNFDLDEARKELGFVKKIVATLDMLNCSEDIDIRDFCNEDWKNLNYLVSGIFEKKPITGLRDELPVIRCLNIGKLRFAVYNKKLEDDGAYQMYDFFKCYIPLVCENMNGTEEKLPVSQFILLRENDFLLLNNIDFDALLPSFQKEEHNCATYIKANEFLLELLKAYDKAKGVRKGMILKVCMDFSKWIMEAPEDELDCQIKILNVLQTIKRSRDLKEDEVSALCTMIESKETREECKVGAYLLLEQQNAAEVHFAKLTEDEQEQFTRYPIYRFWAK